MKPPDWVKNAIFYQIFPDRFYNGDETNDPVDVVDWNEKPTPHNFFGGDLLGIIKKLDYLENLGVNAIYLNPIFKAPSNHKYDTEDYYQVDPHFGDSDTLKELVSRAHERGMKVILDGVFNHCGEKFFAFQDVVERGEKSRYWNWFIVDGFPITKYPEPNYRCWAGVPSMPEFNTKNPETREYLLKVVEHWIKEADIDGWRLDAVEYLEPDFVRDVRRRAKSVKNEIYIVGEVVGIATSWFKGEALDGVMNYKLWELLVDFFANHRYDARRFNSMLYFLRRSYPEWANYSMFNLLGSHDRPRFLTLCKGDVRKMKLAITFLMTYLGAPAIYYGDEIGMQGESDPDCRRAFIWDERSQNLELLNFYKLMISLRKKHPALRNGRFRSIYFERNLCVYSRETNEEKIIIILNNSENTERLTVSPDFISDLKDVEMVDLTTGERFEMKGGSLNLVVRGYSFKLLLASGGTVVRGTMV